MSGGAWFSDCGTYRYALLRLVDLGLDGLDGKQDRCLNVVMLNPSVADDVQDDPTIRRCIGYARRWGYGELMVTNLFAYCATDPREMKRADDPVGPENDAYIRKIAGAADLILVAWGAHGGLLGRNAAVLSLLSEIGKPVHCLATSKDGHPKHPLYLRADLESISYAHRAAAGRPRQDDGAATGDLGQEPVAREASDAPAGESPARTSERGADAVPSRTRPATRMDAETLSG